LDAVLIGLGIAGLAAAAGSFVLHARGRTGLNHAGWNLLVLLLATLSVGAVGLIFLFTTCSSGY
jgi:hypothetical protein